MQQYHALLILFTMVLTAHATPAAAVTLHFCYEDKALEPYYLGDGRTVPATNPGATIEHLQQLTASVSGIQLQLERLPWKRCLAKLASGETDAIVASYRPERAEFGRFPLLAGQPDPSRAFAQHQTCLVRKAGANWNWDGHQVTGISNMIIARPLGYAPLTVPGPSQVLMHFTLSGTMDLDLLQAGRVHAATTLCQIAGQPIQSPYVTKRDLEVVTPALHSNNGYLIFSQAFYQRQPRLAEALWQQLKSDKGAAIYHRYLAERYQQNNSPPEPAEQTTPPVH